MTSNIGGGGSPSWFNIQLKRGRRGPTDTGGRSIDRPNILKLYRSLGGSKLKTAGIGAGVGAGAGAIVGVASTDPGWFRGPAILLTTGIGGIVGSLVGLVIGPSRNKQLVYDSVVP